MIIKRSMPTFIVDDSIGISPFDGLDKESFNRLNNLKNIQSETKCTICGMVWKGVMGYSCPISECYIQPKINMLRRK
jgi:hypothetical protein